jgi:hypothetical protein
MTQIPGFNGTGQSLASADHSLVQVHWSGPFAVGEVITGDCGKGSGVYQVYGHHVVFGANALLYVGMTDDQTFSARFGQHEHWLRFENDVEVRLGVFKDPNGRALLADVEALTIWWHSPPYNSKNIWQYRGNPVHIQNWGARGRLDAEYTSHWEEAKLSPPEGEAP